MYMYQTTDRRQQSDNTNSCSARHEVVKTHTIHWSKQYKYAETNFIILFVNVPYSRKKVVNTLRNTGTITIVFYFGQNRTKTRSNFHY